MIPSEKLEVLGRIVVNEKFERAQGHVESQILVVAVGSVVDYIE